MKLWLIVLPLFLSVPAGSLAAGFPFPADSGAICTRTARVGGESRGDGTVVVAAVSSRTQGRGDRGWGQTSPDIAIFAMYWRDRKHKLWMLLHVTNSVRGWGWLSSVDGSWSFRVLKALLFQYVLLGGKAGLTTALGGPRTPDKQLNVLGSRLRMVIMVLGCTLVFAALGFAVSRGGLSPLCGAVTAQTRTWLVGTGTLVGSGAQVSTPQ